MGKITYLGPVPKDDPMFSGGPEIFSRPASRKSSTNSASGTTGATPAVSPSVDGKKLTLEERFKLMRPAQIEDLANKLL